MAMLAVLALAIVIVIAQVLRLAEGRRDRRRADRVQRGSIQRR